MIPWWQTAEVKSRIDNLHPSSLDIQMEGNRLVWKLPDDLEASIDRVIDKQVDNEVGYAFADYDGPMRDRWIEVYEQQATVSSHLSTIFGDPNILLGYGLKTARKMHKNDPGLVKRYSEMERDVSDFLNNLNND